MPAGRAQALLGPRTDGFLPPPPILTGRNNGENGVSVFRAQMDACRWARVPARATCLCLRGGPDLVLDPEGAAG